MTTHLLAGHLRNVEAGSIQLLRTAVVCCFPMIVAACASAPLQEGGTLSSYSSLKPSDGVLTKTRQHVDKRAVLGAKTVKIVPAEASIGAARSGLTHHSWGLWRDRVARLLREVLPIVRQPALDEVSVRRMRPLEGLQRTAFGCHKPRVLVRGVVGAEHLSCEDDGLVHCVSPGFIIFLTSPETKLICWFRERAVGTEVRSRLSDAARRTRSLSRN